MTLKGKLGYREIADIFNAIEISKKSGLMRITHEDCSARLFFEWGELIRAESSRFKDRLGELLVERGALTAEEVGRALDIQRSEGMTRKLGIILCKECGVSEDEIQTALAAQFKSIVADVLSWTDGVFEFDSEKHSDKTDQFSLCATDFLLEVGIEAGLLARRAEEGKRPPCVILLEEDASFSGFIAAELEKEGIGVLRALNLEEVRLATGQNEVDALLLSACAKGAAGVSAEALNEALPVIAYGKASPGGADGIAAAAFVALPSGCGNTIDGRVEGVDLFAKALARAVDGFLK